MNWLDLRHKCRMWGKTSPARELFELGLSLLVGVLVGALIVFSYGLASEWQQLVVIIPVALAFVLLINDLDRIVLAAIAIGVPLNLDVSLIISPYARNPANIARGGRTIIALTELRVSIVTAMLIIGYALWLIEARGPNRKPVRFFPAITIPALGLIVFSVLSVFRAQDQQLALFRIVQLVELFLTYFYLANHIRTVDDLKFFVFVSIGGMFAESILMIVQWITNRPFSIAGVQAIVVGPGRVGGTLGHTGPAGGYLSALAVIACAAIWASSKLYNKTFAALSFGLGSIALISTGSRISWIAFAATLPLLVVFGQRRGWVRAGNAALIAVAVLVVGAGFYDAIETRLSAEDYGSAEARPMMWRLAWNMIEAHPWLGVGAGNHALMTPEYYTPDVGDPGQVIDIQVHNRYLLIWAESGTFAFLCYVGFLGSAVVKAWSCIGARNRWISLTGAALGCAIISLCVQMVTATFVGRSHALFVWLMPALAAALAALKHVDPSEGTSEEPAWATAGRTGPRSHIGLPSTSRRKAGLDQAARSDSRGLRQPQQLPEANPTPAARRI